MPDQSIALDTRSRVATITLFNNETITADSLSAIIRNENFKSALVIIEATAVSGTSPTLTPRLRGMTSLQNQRYIIASGTALAGPGITTISASVLPEFFELILEIAGSTPSFTVTAELRLYET